jgi:hypothetical protein
MKLTQCMFSGSLSGTKNIGGLIGTSAGYVASSNIQLTMTACKAIASIACDDSNAGGLIGYSSEAFDMTADYAIADFDLASAATNIGGLIGLHVNHHSTHSQINCSYAVVKPALNVTKAGGDIGYAQEGYVDMADFCTTSTIYSSSYKVKTTNCYGDCKGSDIVSYLQDSGSQYLSNWNFNKTVSVSAVVKGNRQSVSCPALQWE